MSFPSEFKTASDFDSVTGYDEVNARAAYRAENQLREMAKLPPLIITEDEYVTQQRNEIRRVWEGGR